MIKQTLMFSTPVLLSLKLNQMVIRFRDSEDEVTRPIEDIGVVIVENQMVQITVPLLNALAGNNVSVVFCDSKAMPNTMLMPLVANSTQQESYRCQMEASLPTKKRIWKEIVEWKIRNQAALLNKLGKNGSCLRQYYENVLSGDSDNREGAAAKVYWQRMFGKGFVRRREGMPPNALLNYGYSILRAAVARALLGFGLLPAFGLFHRNRYNAFPLADDVMEVYRPYVDEIVYSVYMECPDIGITKEVKQRLLEVLFADVRMNKQTKPLEVALSFTTASLVRALKDNRQHIVCPKML